MHDSLSVKVGDSVEDLIDGPARLRFFAFEGLHERAVAGILHHEEDVVLVIEMAVELHDVRVGEAVVDAQLSGELFLHAIFPDGRFEDLLDGTEEASCPVHAQIDISELARPDALSQLEVGDAQVGRGHWLGAEVLEEINGLAGRFYLCGMARVVPQAEILVVVLQWQRLTMHQESPLCSACLLNFMPNVSLFFGKNILFVTVSIGKGIFYYFFRVEVRDIGLRVYVGG